MTRNVLASAVCLLAASCAAAPAERPGAEVAPPPAAVAATESREVASIVSRVMDASPRREIGALEGVLASTARTSPDRPKILRRLAEDYVAVEAAAQREGGPAGEIKAQAARRKAIEHYTQLAAEYPSWCSSGDKGCGDEVLFYLAHEHEQEREPAEARRVYREIIKGWPLSRYVPNAYLAFAEMYFDEGVRDPSKLALAEKAYLEVLRFPPPDNTVAAYAHYKLAYVHYNRGDTARALQQMIQAIEVSEANPKLRSASQIAREARRDLIPIYAAGGDPTKAYDFLAAHGGGKTEQLHAMLEALAQAYVETGKLETAVEIYVDWLSRDAGPKTCAVVKGIDAVIARAAGVPGAHAKVQLAAAASAPLMKARVECASAP